jgi:hypothetical protein
MSFTSFTSFNNIFTYSILPILAGSGTYVAPTTNTYNSAGVSYTTYIFTGDGTLNIRHIIRPTTINVLAVGGGGSSGTNIAGAYATGGGGGGGFISKSHIMTTGNDELITITIGQGGGKGDALSGSGNSGIYRGQQGGQTVLTYSSRSELNLTADGGGAGSAAYPSRSGTTGGSGGGAGGNTANNGYAATGLTDNIGNKGGDYKLGTSCNLGGGGGGAGTAGSTGSGTTNGSGGDGKSSTLPGVNPDWYFAGGGGGGCMSGFVMTAGKGGIGGGGGGIAYKNNATLYLGTGGGSAYYTLDTINNAYWSGTFGSGNYSQAGIGLPNSGGGAGANGFGYSSTNGTPYVASGGSGIVIITVQTSDISAAT